MTTYTVKGTWGEQIVDELKPADGDVVVKKYRTSGFMHTNLDFILRNHGIKTLVITGVLSHGCVFATARSGKDSEYFIVIAKDAMNSVNKFMHKHGMKLIEMYFDSFTTDQIINIWKK